MFRVPTVLVRVRCRVAVEGCGTQLVRAPLSEQAIPMRTKLNGGTQHLSLSAAIEFGCIALAHSGDEVRTVRMNSFFRF